LRKNTLLADTPLCAYSASLDALNFDAPWQSATRKTTSATAGTKIENLVPASACFCIQEEHDRVSHGGVGWYCGAKSAYMWCYMGMGPHLLALGEVWTPSFLSAQCIRCFQLSHLVAHLRFVDRQPSEPTKS
jgi:hypothetical protein